MDRDNHRVEFVDIAVTSTLMGRCDEHIISYHQPANAPGSYEVMNAIMP